MSSYESLPVGCLAGSDEGAMMENVTANPITGAGDVRPSHYVAIGASAGGLEAIEAFFTAMPPDSDLAFIVVQHLSPDYKSLMVDILSKKTAMPVQRAEDGMLVLPRQVYLIPPKKNLTIFHGKLLLSEQDHSKGINLPIDVFLRSLAEDQGERAVGIILSGTGSDGMRGVRSIKECGGMVMVQDEESAKFNGMPRAAISTGLPDFILTPDDMPRQLLAFIKHPYVAKSERAEVLLSDEDGLTRVFALLREKCKVDFTHYKPSTVTRRIERRMTINHIENIRDYVTFLVTYPGEVMALFRELLIGVTNFFRDTTVFEALSKDCLPDLFRSASNREIRFWTAGCSTGEEAYSLAIAARECMEELGTSHDLKIFATDVDRDAILFAAAGTYPESIAADLSPRLLSKYFHRRDESFQISRSIREMVVFAQHNLIKDPPFTNLDLVSCRNLLIYLQPVLQKKVLEFFNFSLNPAGILMLGNSETIGEMGDFFDTVDLKSKLYRSRGRLKPAVTSSMIDLSDTRYREMRGRFASTRRALRGPEDERILERFMQSLAGDYIPLTVIVNEQMEVLNVIGDTTGFFQIPSGKVTLDVTRMAVKELAIPLSTGIQKVFRQNLELRFSKISLKREDKARLIDMRIKPLPMKKGQDPLVAIFLSEMEDAPRPSSSNAEIAYDLSKEAEQRIHDLEQELQFNRENLQATIEELETSNEELQATNEELLASNEELQSTNEELQSTNEELHTVNAEYHNKIIELTELHNDVDNLLTASNIGKLLLDENLEVRRFSNQITSIFKLLTTDVGRPITHIAHYLAGVDPIQVIREVQESSKPAELEVETRDGVWYLMRVVPYVIGPRDFSGMVVSFVDISQIKKAEDELKASEEKYRTLFQTMDLGVVYQGADGKILSANPAAERMLGLTLDQLQGRTSIDPRWKAIREDGSPFPGEEHPAMVALSTGRRVNDVVMGVFNPKQDDYSWLIVDAVPQFKPGQDKPCQVYATIDDITRRRAAERALRESEEQYRTLFQELNNGFAFHEMIFDDQGKPCDYRFLNVNPAFERITGLKGHEIIGRRVLEVFPQLEHHWIERYGRVVTTGEPVLFEEYNEALKKHFEVRAFVTKPGQFAVIFRDVTELKQRFSAPIEPRETP